MLFVNDFLQKQKHRQQQQQQQQQQCKGIKINLKSRLTQEGIKVRQIIRARKEIDWPNRFWAIGTGNEKKLGVREWSFSLVESQNHTGTEIGKERERERERRSEE